MVSMNKPKSKKSKARKISIKKYSPKIIEMSEKYSKSPEEFLMRADGRCEWVCSHGVGHTVCVPKEYINSDAWWSHGCDGCEKYLLKENLLPYDRLTIIDETGRVYERYNIVIQQLIQDDGKTLKLFINEKKKTK